jgi:addiction module RelB/DinJ family antitoxin
MCQIVTLTERIQVRISAETKEKAERYLAERHLTLSELVRIVVEQAANHQISPVLEMTNQATNESIQEMINDINGKQSLKQFKQVADLIEDLES